MFTFALYNFLPYYCLLVFAFGGLWRPNRIIGHLRATSLATLAALATLVALATLAALAALVSNVLVFDLHNFHSYYCLLFCLCGGLWRPNRIAGHLKARLLAVLAALAALASLLMCLYLLYPTFTPTIVYFILPLEACGGQIAF